jgi:hypothetical protein
MVNAARVARFAGQLLSWELAELIELAEMPAEYMGSA